MSLIKNPNLTELEVNGEPGRSHDPDDNDNQRHQRPEPARPIPRQAPDNRLGHGTPAVPRGRLRLLQGQQPPERHERRLRGQFRLGHLRAKEKLLAPRRAAHLHPLLQSAPAAAQHDLGATLAPGQVRPRTGPSSAQAHLHVAAAQTVSGHEQEPAAAQSTGTVAQDPQSGQHEAVLLGQRGAAAADRQHGHAAREDSRGQEELRRAAGVAEDAQCRREAGERGCGDRRA